MLCNPSLQSSALFLSTKLRLFQASSFHMLHYMFLVGAANYARILQTLQQTRAQQYLPSRNKRLGMRLFQVGLQCFTRVSQISRVGFATRGVGLPMFSEAFINNDRSLINLYCGKLRGGSYGSFCSAALHKTGRQGTFACKPNEKCGTNFLTPERAFVKCKPP